MRLLFTIMKKISIVLFPIVIVAIALISFSGYRYRLDWVGVSDYTTPQVGEGEEYQQFKTFWDWMELLVVPVTFSYGAWLVSERQKSAEEKQAGERR